MTEKPLSRSEVARKLLELAAAFLDRETPTETVLSRLDKVHAWVKDGAPPKAKRPPRQKTAEELAIEEERKRAASATEQRLVDALWAYWRSQTRKTWECTPTRRGKLLAALRAGNGPAKLEAAIRGMVAHPWNSGRDPRTNGEQFFDVEHLLRHLDKFADAGGYRETLTGSAQVHSLNAAKVTKLEKERDDALRAGDQDGYEAARAAIARLHAGSGD